MSPFKLALVCRALGELQRWGLIRFPKWSLLWECISVQLWPTNRGLHRALPKTLCLNVSTSKTKAKQTKPDQTRQTENKYVTFSIFATQRYWMLNTRKQSEKMLTLFKPPLLEFIYMAKTGSPLYSLKAGERGSLHCIRLIAWLANALPCWWS